MYYSNAEEVRKRMKSMEKSGDFADVNVDTYIQRADNLINATLAEVYNVPFAAAPSEPPLIGDLSADLAAAYVLKFMFPPRAGQQGSPAEAYERSSLDTLAQIADGTLRLVGADGKVIERAKESVKEAFFQVFGG